MKKYENERGKMQKNSKYAEENEQIKNGLFFCSIDARLPNRSIPCFVLME